MIDTIYALGEGNSYHLECPSRWCNRALPSDIMELFNKNEVSTGYHMSLGANSSFIFSYKTKPGGQTRLLTNNIPEDLNEWLYAKDKHGDYARVFSKIFVTLGPENKSWFATDGQDYRWHNLPKDLQKFVNDNIKDGSWSDTPRFVSLGVDDNFVFITKSNSAYWETGKYPLIEEAFTEFQKHGNVDRLHNVTLSPHEDTRCVIHYTNGVAYSQGMPAVATEHCEVMAAAIKSDTEKAEEAEKDLAYQRSVARIKDNERAIRLNNMASDLATRQMAHNVRSADYINNIGYVCSRCKHHPHDCTCNGGGGGMGSI